MYDNVIVTSGDNGLEPDIETVYLGVCLIREVPTLEPMHHYGCYVHSVALILCAQDIILSPFQKA